MAVDIAAPLIPNIGIKKVFKIIFTMQITEMIIDCKTGLSSRIKIFWKDKYPADIKIPNKIIQKGKKLKVNSDFFVIKLIIVG